MNYTYTDELYHHGIKGQKWGVRRFQNEDGSLTSAGKARYDVGEARNAAITGGLIGYAHYRKTHGGRKEAIANYKKEKKAARLQKAIDRDKAFAKKLNGTTSKEYDRQMKALDDSRNLTAKQRMQNLGKAIGKEAQKQVKSAATMNSKYTNNAKIIGGTAARVVLHRTGYAALGIVGGAAATMAGQPIAAGLITKYASIKMTQSTIHDVAVGGARLYDHNKNK